MESSASPVSAQAKEPEQGLAHGIALCLSGGGYRAIVLRNNSIRGILLDRPTRGCGIIGR